MMPAVESMPRRIRPSERKNDDFAESAHGASYRIVRRADGRIVVGQLDVPVRVLRGLAGLLQVAVEFVEHDVDGFRVGKLFLIELAFVEIVDAADTIPAEQFHPLCHLVAQPGDDGFGLTHLPQADERQRQRFRPLSEVDATLGWVDEDDVMAFEQRFGDHNLRDGGFTGSGFSADEQVERVLHAPVDRFAHIVHAQREHAWFRLAGEIPVRVDHGGERAAFRQHHVVQVRTVFLTAREDTPVGVVCAGQEFADVP